MAALSLLFFTSNAQPISKEIAVSFNKTTMLVFPAKIIDADWGTEDVSIRIAKKTPTVLKVKAATPGFSPTNLTVYTEDGMMYMTSVHYDSLSSNTPYLFHPESEGCIVKPVINGRHIMTMQDVTNLAASLLDVPTKNNHPAVKAGKIRLSLGNIWIKDDLIYFQLKLSNSSPIPYDINLVKYYERDDTRAKRTTIVENEVFPYYEQLSPNNRTQSNASNTLIIVFPKFTIADKKHFTIELFERNGDRHLVLKIKGKHILSATPMP